MEGSVQDVVKQVSNFDGNNADDFLEWSSKLRVSLPFYSSQSSKSYKGRSGHHTPITIRRPLARVGMMAMIIYTASSTSRDLARLLLSCECLKEQHERTE